MEWIETNGAVAGGRVHLSLPELGLDHDLTVVTINPCPAIETASTMKNMPTPPFSYQEAERILEQQFSFLTQAGYHVMTGSRCWMMISNGRISLIFDFEDRSNSIFAEINRVSTNEQFSLYSALAPLLPTAARDTACSARDALQFQEGTQRLSRLCKEHFFDLFMGDDSAFYRAINFANETNGKYTSRCMYGPTLTRAREAWQGKRWDEAKELYESAEAGLSEEDARRLLFLRKRSGKL